MRVLTHFPHVRLAVSQFLTIRQLLTNEINLAYHFNPLLFWILILQSNFIGCLLRLFKVLFKQMFMTSCKFGSTLFPLWKVTRSNSPHFYHSSIILRNETGAWHGSPGSLSVGWWSNSLAVERDHLQPPKPPQAAVDDSATNGSLTLLTSSANMLNPVALMAHFKTPGDGMMFNSKKLVSWSVEFKPLSLEFGVVWPKAQGLSNGEAWKRTPPQMFS